MNHQALDDLPMWRSLLFVPGNNENFVQKATTRGADAIVLDLEDSVPTAGKSMAREMVSTAIAELATSGCDIMVRINDPLRLAVADLEAVVRPGLRAVVIPKAQCADYIGRLTILIGDLEKEQGLESGGVSLIAQIETLSALREMDGIAMMPRVVGLALGTEDLCAEAGMVPSRELLFGPAQALVFAARRQRCVPYGFPASIANYSDPEAFAATITEARAMGFCGGFAVHPSQVPVMNQHFLPSAVELEWAQRVEAAYREGESLNQGAVAVDGRMVDKPVVERALQQLAFAHRFTSTKQ